jgi:drug/metabolite transporter (DMT)-like permease
VDFLYGSTTALTWGVAVFTSRWTVREVGSVRTTFYSHMLALILLTAYVLVTGQLTSAIAAATPATWFWLVLATSFNTLGSLMLYRAVQYAAMSVVVPVSSCYVMLILLFSLLSGEKLAPLKTAGIVLGVAGVIMATLGAQARGIGTRPALGAVLAVASAVSYGLAWWLFGARVTDTLGGAVPTWATRVNSLVMLGSIALLAPARLSLPPPPTGRAWLLLALIGVFEAGGVLASLIGFQTGNVSIISAIGSLYSSVTVLLAFFILRERLLWRQWLGVAAIAAAVVMMSL